MRGPSERNPLPRQNHLDPAKLGCKLAIEAISSVVEELAFIAKQNYQETGLNPEDIPFLPDWAQLLSYELADRCRVVTARYKSVLVGYALYLIGPLKHNKEVLYAELDAVWISPAFRSGFLAVKMMQLGERSIHAMGIKYLMAGSTIKKPIGKLLEFVGFQEREILYWKELGNGKPESTSRARKPRKHTADTGGVELGDGPDAAGGGQPAPNAGVQFLLPTTNEPDALRVRSPTDGGLRQSVECTSPGDVPTGEPSHGDGVRPTECTVQSDTPAS